jgi:hypothetical protein
MPRKRTVDFKLKVAWRELDITNPPGCSGIYAVKDSITEEWFYIGKAKCIAARIVCRPHPIQITKDANLKLSYFYLHAEEKDISWLERYLIREHTPDWNGATAFGAAVNTPWVCCNLPVDYFGSTTTGKDDNDELRQALERAVNAFA